jgi:flagellar motor protein MotB
MKAIPAILFALAMTGLIAIAMLLVGANAFFNPNTVPVASAASPSSITNVSDPSGVASQPALTSDQQQLAVMRQLLQQYQDREKQYQQRLDEAVQRLNAANQQIQQANAQIQQDNQSVETYQQIMQELQRRGIITIDNNGQIYLRRGGGDD